MYRYGFCLYIFVVSILLVALTPCALSKAVNDPKSIKPTETLSADEKLAYSGHLYDVFKKRLDKICSELSFKTDAVHYSEKSPNWTDNEMKKRAALISNDNLYGAKVLKVTEKKESDFKNKDSLQKVKMPATIKSGGSVRLIHDSVHVANMPKLTVDTKSPFIGDGVYDELKRRLGTFMNGLPSDPKNQQKIALVKYNAPKRSTVREGLYEEFKKRLDKINNELGLDGEKVFDRSGRSHQLLETLKESQGEKLSYINPMQDEGQHQTSKRTDTNSVHVNLNQNDPKVWFDHQLSDIHAQATKINLQSKRFGDNCNKRKRRQHTTDHLGITSFDDQMSIYGDVASSYGVESAYPSVLTRTSDSVFNPVINLAGGKNILEKVAHEMNTTTLELAQTLADMPDLDLPSLKGNTKLNRVLTKYLTNSVLSPTQSPHFANVAFTGPLAPIAPIATYAPQQEFPVQPLPVFRSVTEMLKNQAPSLPQAQAPTSEIATKSPPSSADISEILEKVLKKVESLQEQKLNKAGKVTADGAPCDIIGSWDSNELGLRFTISLAKSGERTLGLAEENNILLSIEAHETNPPKHHDIIDTEWLFMGSALKQLGGPFYIYTQKRTENVLATFEGYCRVCSGMDTIFGSWSFILPSKDCQDISTSIENKPDILRRNNMEEKRKERFKDLAFTTSIFAKRAKKHFTPVKKSSKQ